MDLNALIYYEFNNIDFCMNYFRVMGILDLISSRSYRSEIIHFKKKLQINIIIDFINNCNDFIDKKNILNVYSHYLFLYELLKKGE